VLSGCRYIIAAFFVMYDIDTSPENDEESSASKKLKPGSDQPANTSFSFDFF
jgi:hypothetical protein